jgi:hypothetical protein
MTHSEPQWRTEVPPHLIARFGLDQLHIVIFQPLDDTGGKRDGISIELPYGQSAFVDAMATATRTSARVALLCDSHAEAEAAAAHAAPLLPHHRRVAYERAAAGAWDITA